MPSRLINRTPRDQLGGLGDFLNQDIQFGRLLELAPRVGSAILFLLGLAIVVGTAYGGLHGRLAFDDFLFAHEGRHFSVLQGVITLRGYWSGRYSWLALLFSVLKVGGSDYAWYVPLLMAVWLFGLYLLFRRFVSTRMACLLATLALAAVVTATPNPAQSIYYLSASTNCAAPLALAPYVAFWILKLGERPTVGWLPLAALTVSAFVLAGFNEVFTILELGALALWWIYAPKSYRKVLLWVLASCVIGIITMVTAPGNYTRYLAQAPLPGSQQQSIGDLLAFDITAYANQFFGNGLFATLGLAGVAFYASSRSAKAAADIKRAAGQIGLIVFLTVILLAACFLFGVHANRSHFPERTLVIVSAAVVGAITVCAWLLGQTGIKGRPIALLLMVAAIWHGPSYLAETLATSRKAIQFSRAWDNEDRQLRVAGKGADVLANPVDVWWIGGVDYGPDTRMFIGNPNAGRNQNVARYYGLRSVRATW